MVKSFLAVSRCNITDRDFRITLDALDGILRGSPKDARINRDQTEPRTKQEDSIFTSASHKAKLVQALIGPIESGFRSAKLLESHEHHDQSPKSQETKHVGQLIKTSIVNDRHVILFELEDITVLGSIKRLRFLYIAEEIEPQAGSITEEGLINKVKKAIRRRGQTTRRNIRRRKHKVFKMLSDMEISKDARQQNLDALRSILQEKPLSAAQARGEDCSKTLLTQAELDDQETVEAAPRWKIDRDAERAARKRRAAEFAGLVG